MPSKSRNNVAEIISDFRGVYARVAQKLRVSPSFVSKVANGHRVSGEIDEALQQELKLLKDKLHKLF